MRAYIKKIRSKSEDTRKGILVGTLIICMSLVVLVWVGTLGHSSKEKKASITTTEEAIKPFALFGQQISDTFKNISASVGNVSSLPTQIEEQVQEPMVKEDTNTNTNTNTETEQQIDLTPIETQSR